MIVRPQVFTEPSVLRYSTASSTGAAAVPTVRETARMSDGFEQMASRSAEHVAGLHAVPAQDLNTPGWWGVHARDPLTDPRTDSLLNLMSLNDEARTATFAPWVAEVRENRAPPLSGVLRKMHRTLAQGGHLGKMGGYQPPPLRGGEMLMDTNWLTSLTPYELHLDEVHFPEMKGWNVDHIPERRTRLPLPGLPERTWGSNLLTRTEGGPPRFDHEYIPVRYHRNVLQWMDEALRHVVKDGPLTSSRLDDLARYYHLGIHAQLFRRVNNSLLMTQVNHLLGEAGHPGISHGLLDLEALTRPLPEFQEIFRAAVEARGSLPG